MIGLITDGTRVTICIPMGSSHLPPEDIINTPRTEAQEIRQVRRFEEWEDMSLDSPPTAERRSWGVDPSLLYFEPDDVILIVDGEWLCVDQTDPQTFPTACAICGPSSSHSVKW